MCLDFDGYNIIPTLYLLVNYLKFTIHICIPGEIFELKAELNSDKKDRKKEAVKKVIASMTVGKDVRWVCAHKNVVPKCTIQSIQFQS